MGVLLLGPVAVEGAARRSPGGRKEGAVLAMLALNVNRRVSASTLIDVLWEEEPPPTATKTLRSYISRLRRLLDSAGCPMEVERGGEGYTLVGDPVAVDACVAEDLAERTMVSLRDGAALEARALAEKALALWRGDALADFATERWAVPYIAKLAELHVVLLGLRIEAALAGGAHAEVLPDLEHLTAAHPLRERLWGLRMLALYRCGRQTDALRAYHQIRVRLIEEVGIEPGPELRELERAILAHSAVLHASTTAVRGDATDRPGPPARIRFARNDGIHLAYRIDGEGPLDILVLAGGLIPVDALGDEPALARALERLGRSGRVIHFDRRGLGMSDPTPPHSPPTLEQWTSDTLAVLDAAGCGRAAVLAWADGALLGVVLAAAHPERVSTLIIVNGFARFTEAPDQPWGVGQAEAERVLHEVTDPTPGSAFDVLHVVAPSVADDPLFRQWWDRAGHQAASPATAQALRRVVIGADVRSVLPAVQVPTLVLHRRADAATSVEHGRYLAQAIPGASYVELPGADDPWWLGDGEAVLDEVERALVSSSLPSAPSARS